jgi:hypothetical protein
MTGRKVAAWICRINGAYLIGFDNSDGYLTESEMFSAASSLQRAKRVAVRDATEMGWQGPHRWEQNGLLWQLRMRRGDDDD